MAKTAEPRPLSELTSDELATRETDLVARQVEIATELDGIRAEKRKRALAKIRAIGAEAGFTLEELFGGEKTKKRQARTPKTDKGAEKTYVHPDDPTRTWSSGTRGRKPAWVSQLEKQR